MLFVTVLNLFIHFFCRLFDSMEKIQICTIFLFQFKLDRKAAKTAHDINEVFSPGTTNERVVQQWFKKFRYGDKSFEDEDGRGWSTVVDNEHLKALIEANPCKTTWEVAVVIKVDHSTVVCHLKQIGKSKKLDKWVPHDLNDNQKKSLFWGVFYAPSAQQKRPISQVDCDAWWEMDPLRQPATFGTVVGCWRSSTTLPKAEIAPKKGSGDCMVVCGRSHPSQLLESGRNDYGGEVLPTNWRNAPEAPMYVLEIGQYEGTNSPPWQCLPACCSTDPAEAEWIGLRDCLICHIHQTSHPPIITFSSISRTSCAKKCFKSQDDAESAFNDFIASRTPDFNANGINKLVSHWQKCVDSNGSYFN